MTKSEFEKWNKAAVNGSIEDDLNPVIILSMTDASLLVKVVSGEINLLELAKRQLEARGLDAKGTWVGFDKTIQ